jgi:hypothetical protein
MTLNASHALAHEGSRNAHNSADFATGRKQFDDETPMTSSIRPSGSESLVRASARTPFVRGTVVLTVSTDATH